MWSAGSRSSEKWKVIFLTVMPRAPGGESHLNYHANVKKKKVVGIEEIFQKYEI